MIAIDEKKARALAKDIIFGSENGVSKDWVNWDKAFGAEDHVELVSHLTPL